MNMNKVKKKLIWGIGINKRTILLNKIKSKVVLKPARNERSYRDHQCLTKCTDSNFTYRVAIPTPISAHHKETWEPVPTTQYRNIDFGDTNLKSTSHKVTKVCSYAGDLT